MFRLIDTHAHLDSPEYGGGRLEKIINAAKAAGVEKIISPGCNDATSLRNVELAKEYKDFIYAAYGFHPHNAEEFDCRVHLKKFRDLAGANKIAAAGEIGLDYYRDISPREVQKKVFCDQLKAAYEIGFPIIIHIRDAFDDFKKFASGFNVRGVIHCYSGNLEFTKWAIDKGFYISFTASITYALKSVYKMAAKTGRSVYDVIIAGACESAAMSEMRKLFDAIPVERIMVETDSPYMAPQNLRGKIEFNEPANVSAPAEVIAALKGIRYEDFCSIACDNAALFFRLNPDFQRGVPSV